MSALLDDGGLRPPRPQLGALLVERALLTQEQLEAALADQRTSGRPLGVILIERGFVRATTVAQALATQHGSMQKTEYGFATGFGSSMPTGSPTEPAPVLLPLPVPEPAPIELPPAAETPEAAWSARVSALEARVAELERRL